MAKRGQPDDPGTTGDSETNNPGWNADSVSEALREAGRKAVELSSNPAARALFAAGLAAAAAAIASNKNVRDATKRNIKEAQEATGAAFENVAENANKIGAAIVNSAIDAVQTLMKTTPSASTTAEPQAAASPAAAPRPARARKPAAAKAPAAKAKAPAKSSAAKTSTAEAAAKPAAKTAAKPRARKKASDTPAG